MAQPIRNDTISVRYKRPGNWIAGYHTGVDIGSPYGTRVYATKSGRVKHVGWGGWGRAYGAHIIIQDRTGKRHGYMHLSRTAVRVGQWVKENDYIGRVGSTGNSTGPHLHYEVRKWPWRYNNRIDNPEKYFSKPVYLSKLHFGQRNSRSVKALKKALRQRYPNSGLTKSGNYTKSVDRWVRKHQKDMGMKVDDKYDSNVGPYQAKLLGLYVVGK
jgi:murein DD-endopeptidase MepM/ murein hydrolase activator NlpD